MIANMRLTSSQRRMLLKIIVHLFYRLYPQMTMDAWEESEHKRDKNGKFSATGTGGSSTEENSSEPMKKRAESGIIEEGKKYVLPEKYKTMTDSDVEAYFTDTEGKCILSDSFRKLPLQAKQTIVHGFDTAEKLFGKKIRLQSVTCKKLSNAYGEYDPKKVSITFDPDLCSKEEDSVEFYATTVHELTHHMQYRGNMDAKKIMNAVWHDKTNSYRSKDFHTRAAIRAIVNGSSKAVDDPLEIVAHAVDKAVTGRYPPDTEGLIKAIIKQCNKAGFFNEEGL